METMPQDDKTSLLDLLLVVVENIKLLILGPLLVGLLALGVGYALPQSFTSAAIVAIPAPTATLTQTAAQVAVLMVSPIVLDPVIESLQLSSDLPLQSARAALSKQIKAAVGRDGLLRLNVTAHTPLQAQTIANAVIDTWLKSTPPGKQDRADLETRLVYAKSSLAAVTKLLERLTIEGSAVLNKSVTRGEEGSSLVALGSLQALYLADVLNIPRTLQGLSRDVVVQPPTLPTEQTAPKKGLIAVLATLGSGFALLLFVFMRQALRGAAQAPESAEKMSRLGRAWNRALGRP